MEKARLHQSLYRIAEALSASLELEPMPQQVLEATAKKVWLKAASIRLIDPKRQVLHLVAAFGLSEAHLAKGTVHLARSPLDQRVLQGSAVVLYDVEREAGFEYPAEAVLSHLKPQDEILILGPGQAKSQLGHRIEQYGNLKGKMVGLEDAPKLANVELVFPISEVWRSEKTHEIQVESPSLQLVPESLEQPGSL
jgi:hypothetical protein